MRGTGDPPYTQKMGGAYSMQTFFGARRAAVSVGVALVLLAAGSSASYGQAQGWNEYTYASAGFAVSGPSDPALSKTSTDSAFGQIEIRVWTWDLSPSVMMIGVNDYPSTGTFDTEETLNGAAAGEVKAWKGGRVVSKTPILVAGITGIECVLESDDYHGRSRIFFQGHRLWQVLSLSAIGQPLYEQTDRIFASFRFLPAQ
jgi:hypothetical protein